MLSLRGSASRVFRPFVPISLAYGDQSVWQLTGLIDTGADAILASNLLAEPLGIDLVDNEGESTFAQAVAVEDRDAFDERFGPTLSA